MRVMVCVEELGLVGNELALDVKPDTRCTVRGYM